MAFLKWSDDMSVGITQIDVQHQQLVAMVNELYDAMSRGVGETQVAQTVQELAGYVAVHFKTEEDLMQTHGYGEFAEHKAVHDKLTAQVKKLLAGVNAGQEINPVQLAGFLKDWLVKHIKGTDMKYAPFLQAAGVK